MEDKYNKLLSEGGLFFYGPTKGSFILPPHGYAVWKNIQNILDKKFASRGVQNVLLPTLIPLNLLEKEKKHIAGFSPECFYVEKVGEKELEVPLILRPTSEWCSVFRAEKNTAPFFRNTEFLWQEGHTLHNSAEEARQFTLNILADYQDYAENFLNLAVIVGRKTEGEKFAGALETYTVECLLPDGQCLQFATSHYFGDNFCRLMGVRYQDRLILPFEIAPIQIAFILIGKSQELINYYQEIYSLLTPYFRCQLYNKYSRDNLNVLQADKEGCPFKIKLGKEELEKNEIALVRRDNIERIITINLASSETEKKYLTAWEKYGEEIGKINGEKIVKEEGKRKMINSYKKGEKFEKIIKIITREIAQLQKNLYQKSVDFRDKHIYPIDNFAELEKNIKKDTKGLFLIPFCNQLDCEIKIKEKVLSYSIRCIASEEKITETQKCLFCQSVAQVKVYLGRSY